MSQISFIFLLFTLIKTLFFLSWKCCLLLTSAWYIQMPFRLDFFHGSKYEPWSDCSVGGSLFCRDFPTFLNLGPQACWIWENIIWAIKIGKTRFGLKDLGLRFKTVFLCNCTNLYYCSQKYASMCECKHLQLCYFWSAFHYIFTKL